MKINKKRWIYGKKFNQQEYINEYKRKYYKRIAIELKKEDYEKFIEMKNELKLSNPKLIMFLIDLYKKI